jgi:hypothetical protein
MCDYGYMEDTVVSIEDMPVDEFVSTMIEKGVDLANIYTRMKARVNGYYLHERSTKTVYRQCGMGYGDLVRFNKKDGRYTGIHSFDQIQCITNNRYCHVHYQMAFTRLSDCYYCGKLCGTINNYSDFGVCVNCEQLLWKLYKKGCVYRHSDWSSDPHMSGIPLIKNALSVCRHIDLEDKCDEKQSKKCNEITEYWMRRAKLTDEEKEKYINLPQDERGLIIVAKYVMYLANKGGKKHGKKIRCAVKQ